MKRGGALVLALTVVLRLGSRTEAAFSLYHRSFLPDVMNLSDHTPVF